MLMGAILAVAAVTLCLYLLRWCWRLLVDVPDADQVWAPDRVDDVLTRLLSAALILGSALFLALMAQALG